MATTAVAVNESIGVPYLPDLSEWEFLVGCHFRENPSLGERQTSLTDYYFIISRPFVKVRGINVFANISCI